MGHTKIQESDLDAVFDTELTSAQKQSFIDDAHLLVDELLGGDGLSEGRLQLVEKYLAAGLAELRDPRASENRAAGTTVKWMQSSYLERAVAMDPTGKLRKHLEAPEDAVQFRAATRAGPQRVEASVSDEQQGFEN